MRVGVGLVLLWCLSSATLFSAGPPGFSPPPRVGLAALACQAAPLLTRCAHFSGERLAELKAMLVGR